MKNAAKRPEPISPISEEALDKMIELIEGPLNRAGERILTSKLVLAPLSLGMDLSMRVIARLMGRRSKKDGAR